MNTIHRPNLAALIVAALALASACSGGDDEQIATANVESQALETSAPTQPEAPSQTTTTTMTEPALVEVQEFPMPSAVFQIGAFAITFEPATVQPLESSESYALVLPFQAENRSTELHRPFSGLGGDGMLLDIGGELIIGARIESDDVPGQRIGKGMLLFEVPGSIDPEAVPSAVLTIGDASLQQAVVPLNETDPPTTLADIPLEVSFDHVIEESRIQFTGDARVQFGSRGANELAPSGRAYAVIPTVLVGPADMRRAGTYWGVEHTFLTRPDGVSVSANNLIVALYAGDREELVLSFEIEEPIAGQYEVGFTNRGDTQSTTFTIS